LVNGETFSIVREEHGAKHRRGDDLHDVHKVASKEDVVIQLGIDDFDVDENHFSL
jgi:hypothetical protein